MDVAAFAGVGVGTVSRALNGVSVRPATREKVERAVAELGYVPSPIARNLKLRRTGVVGLVAETTQAPWFAALLHGVELGLRRHAASVALCSLKLSGEYDATPVREWIRQERVDGLIFVRSGRKERPLIRDALDQGIAVVLVVPDEAVRGAHALRLDNEGGGVIAGEHLLALGHERVAFIGGPEASVDTQGRLRGLIRAVGPIPRSRILFSEDYSVTSGDRAVKHHLAWIRAGRAPTAVVLANDALALGFLRGVRAAGLRVPEDVSVVGFDGVQEGELSNPALTTVAQPVTSIGTDACRIVLERGQATTPKRYAMALVRRESTARPTE